MYGGGLVITRGVTLRGMGEAAAEVEIKGTSRMDPGVAILNPERSEDSFAVAFQNLTLPNRHPAKRHGVEVEGTAAIVLKDAFVVGSLTYVLVLRDQQRAQITSTSIVDTKLGVLIEDSSEAILVDSVLADSASKATGASSVTIEGCDLSNNDVLVSAHVTMDVLGSVLDRSEILIQVNANVSFASCSFSYMTGAISVSGSSPARFEECDISHCQPAGFDHATGLRVRGATVVEVQGCTF